MKKIGFVITLLLLCTGIQAESAKSILDKAAAVVSNPSGGKAHFQMISKQFGSTNGEIAVKGNKFHATTPDATIWFDGKTQWTYIKKNDEVNVSSPKDSELQMYNPYTFIYMYKQGYTYEMTKKGNNYEVHLTGNGKKGTLREMYLTINKKTYIPSTIRIRHSKGWNTIEVSNFKKANLSDGTFRFNSKDFPQAEVIDLR